MVSSALFATVALGAGVVFIAFLRWLMFQPGRVFFSFLALFCWIMLFLLALGQGG